MTKSSLRKIYREKRAALGAVEREKMHDLMLIMFQQFGIEIPEMIMTYAAFKDEYNPQLIEGYCQFKNPGMSVAYPLINENANELECIKVTDDTIFEINRFGIAEPVKGETLSPLQLDLVIVPLLAFDMQGNRVGYGKGYYDRFLKRCRKDALKIGFSFFEAEEEAITDITEQDMKIDYCITPAQIYSFNPLYQ